MKTVISMIPPQIETKLDMYECQSF